MGYLLNEQELNLLTENVKKVIPDGSGFVLMICDFGDKHVDARLRQTLSDGSLRQVLNVTCDLSERLANELD